MIYDDYTILDIKKGNLTSYLEKKYGYDALPQSIDFYITNDEQKKDLAKFRKLLKVNDPKLRTYLWNCIKTWPADISCVNKKSFSAPEYDFISQRFEASYLRKQNQYDVLKNFNKQITGNEIILSAPDIESNTLYKHHLKNDGDFELFTGLKMNRENLIPFSMFMSPYTFSIIEKQSRKMVGMIGIYDYDPIRKIAYIQWYTFKPYRRKGYLKEAISLLSSYAFSRKLFEMKETIKEDIFKKSYANIEIIRASIRSTNIISQKVALSCGFVEQYTDKRGIILDGCKYEDAIIFDLEKNFQV